MEKPFIPEAWAIPLAACVGCSVEEVEEMQSKGFNPYSSEEVQRETTRRRAEFLKEALNVSP